MKFNLVTLEVEQEISFDSNLLTSFEIVKMSLYGSSVVVGGYTASDNAGIYDAYVAEYDLNLDPLYRYRLNSQYVQTSFSERIYDIEVDPIKGDLHCIGGFNNPAFYAYDSRMLIYKLEGTAVKTHTMTKGIGNLGYTFAVSGSIEPLYGDVLYVAIQTRHFAYNDGLNTYPN